MRIGQHLFTKDGSKIGNAIIVDRKPNDDPRLGGLWQIETDFGNGGSWLTAAEVYDWWYLTREDGLIVISAPEEWRERRRQAQFESATRITPPPVPQAPAPGAASP